MSRSRYIIIVAGLFLGTSLLLAQGGHVSADEWDYSEWNYFDSVDYSSPPPQTDTDWEDAYYYPLELIQDPYNVLQTQDSQPIDNYGLWDGGVIYAPASNAESGNPDVTQSSFFAAQSESEAQTIVPPENNLFTRIFGNWNLTEQPPAPPEMPVVLADNDSAILQLPPGWGVSETRTDTYTGPLQNLGGQALTDASDNQPGGNAALNAIRQGPVDLDEVVNRNLSYQGRGSNSLGPQSVVAPSLITRALQVARDLPVVSPVASYFSDIFTRRNADNESNANTFQFTGLGPNRISAQSGGVDYSANWRPGNVYFQAGWNIDSNFRLVK